MPLLLSEFPDILWSFCHYTAYSFCLTQKDPGQKWTNCGLIGLGHLDKRDHEKRKNDWDDKIKYVHDRKTIDLVETFNVHGIWLNSHSRHMEVLFFSTSLVIKVQWVIHVLVSGLWAMVMWITFKPEYLVAGARFSRLGPSCQGELWSIILRWGIIKWYRVTTQSRAYSNLQWRHDVIHSLLS